MSDCEPVKIREFRVDDEDAIIRLWRDCGLVVPQNDPMKDIARKLGDSPELFLVAEIESVIVGAAMAGYEGHRGSLNYVAVSPPYRRRGIARALVAEAERRLRGLGCPKINLDIRSTNTQVIGFYEDLGYSVDPVISMGKRLIRDDGA